MKLTLLFSLFLSLGFSGEVKFSELELVNKSFKVMRSTKFSRPKCSTQGNCYILLGRVSTSWSLKLNNTVLYNGLEEFTRFHLPFINIPADLFKDKGNTLELTIISGIGSDATITGQVVKVDSFQYLFLDYFKRNMLSLYLLISSLFFLLLIFSTLLVTQIVYSKQLVFQVLGCYTFVSILYLVSFSEIPRLFWDATFLSGGIHFSLRLLQDLTLYFLVAVTFKRVLLYPIVVGYILSIIVMFLLSFFNLTYSFFLSAMQILAIQILFPFSYGLYLSFKEKSSDKGLFKLFFLTFFLLQLNDLFVFWGVYSGFYSVKFYIPIIVLFFLYIFFKRRIFLLKKADYLNKTFVLTRQISHDIRSPLEALRSVTFDLESLNSNTRSIIVASINRISSIANSLLDKSLDSRGYSTLSLKILLDVIVAEKRAEKQCNISFDNSCLLIDSFVSVNENEIYRSLSNLINNAVESHTNSLCKVHVSLISSSSEAIINVRDQGEGMSSNQIERAIIGDYTTKRSGFGLGLSSAKRSVEKNGGSFVIESSPGKGTSIKLAFNRISYNHCFVDEIKVKGSLSHVVCVDASQSFFKFHINHLRKEGMTFEIIDLEEFDPCNIKINSFFLFECEDGDIFNTVDLIIKNKLSERSILISSMINDNTLSSMCNLHNISILPKQIFGNANITVDSEEKFVLIDDDELIHMSWKAHARRTGKRLYCFYSIDEFLEGLKEFSKNETILVDSNLGTSICGELDSERIKSAGFTKIYIVTGTPREEIEKPAWIKEVLSKKPNFNL